MGEKNIEAINYIIQLCSLKDYKDCLRLLNKQDFEILDNIYYNLLFDKNGQETDFIPLGCNYDKLTEILVENGGRKERVDSKFKKKEKDKHREFEERMAEYKRRLTLLEEKIAEKERELRNI